MWFCDHSEWWGVWLLVVEAAPPWEVGLGLLVVELIFTYVCVSFYQ
jgi:hypothetical protein